MTQAEIDDLKARLCRLERLMYVMMGVALGSGVLQISQVVV